MSALHADATFLIRRAHQAAQALFGCACGDLDLTATQYSILAVLHDRGRLSQNEIGRIAGIDRATTSLVVKALRKRKLISAKRHGADRRKVMIRMTRSGRRAHDAGRVGADRANRDLLSVLTESETAQFMEILGLIGRARIPADGGSSVD